MSDLVLFHSGLSTRGGAERLLLEWLRRTKHNVLKIFTWMYNPGKTFEDFANYDVEVLFPSSLSSVGMRGGIFHGLFGLLAAIKTVLPRDVPLFLSASGLNELALLKNTPTTTIAYVQSLFKMADPVDLKWVLNNSSLPNSGSVSVSQIYKRLIYPVGSVAYRILSNIAWRKINAFMFNSMFALQRARRLLRKNSRVSVVWPGVDLPRQVKDSSENTGRVLYLSRITSAKRQIEVVEAWKSIEEKLPKEAILVIAGDKCSQRYYQKLVKVARGHRVLVKPNLSKEEVEAEYSRADACVFAGWHEDFGIAPLEALAYGKPLITVNVGGFWDVLRATRAPGVISVEDSIDRSEFVRAMGDGFREFFRSMDTWKELGRKNRDALRKIDLSWDRMTAEIDMFIDETLEG